MFSLAIFDTYFHIRRTSLRFHHFSAIALFFLRFSLFLSPLLPDCRCRHFSPLFSSSPLFTDIDYFHCLIIITFLFADYFAFLRFSLFSAIDAISLRCFRFHYWLLITPLIFHYFDIIFISSSSMIFRLIIFSSFIHAFFRHYFDYYVFFFHYFDYAIIFAITLSLSFFIIFRRRFFA